MTVVVTQTPPIYLAGRWVESPDVLVVENPADPKTPAGATYNATEAQYEEAVTAAVAAFEETRKLPAYERGRDPARDQRRDQGAPRGDRPADRARSRASPSATRWSRWTARSLTFRLGRRGGRADDRRASSRST